MAAVHDSRQQFPHGGLTWTASILNPGQFRSDPVLRADADGTFYYSVFSFGGDKQWIAIDKSNGRGNIYPHCNVQFTSFEGTSFTRLTNGGASFDNPTPGPVPSSK